MNPNLGYEAVNNPRLKVQRLVSYDGHVVVGPDY